MMRSLAVSALALLSSAGAASADLSFTFSDATPGEITNTTNGTSPGVGRLTYNSSAVLNFIVNGATEPTPFLTAFPNARMELDMAIGTASSFMGVVSAPLSGFFRIYNADTGNDILRGDAGSGAFVRFGSSNALLFSDPVGLVYTFGADLIALLAPGRVPTSPVQDGVFTLTNVRAPSGAPLNIGAGMVPSFTADTAFTGSVTIIPTPGAAALMAIGGLVATRRRR
ncbi:MAG: hypothetical protein ACK5WB_10055 [Phycisphaerales bacterium]|nr:hypothetical protein [Phycisphaeraceae bacterium]